MSTEPLVLAIDDEAGILRLIKLELSGQGFRIITANSGEDGLRMAEEHRPDLVVLDVVMPDIAGPEVMRRLRERSGVPVIMLTAKGGEADRVRGLELGADDYLAKPFSPEELSARVRAVLRRTIAPPNTDSVVRAGGIEIDLHRRTVTRDGEPVSLTRTEWMLLQHLAANAGRVMLNAELLSRVWGPEYLGDLQYLRVWISRLRRKIEAEPSNPRLLKTFQGIGYMFAVKDDIAPDDEADEAASTAEEEAAVPA